MKLRHKVTLIVSIISILSIVFMIALYSMFLFQEKIKETKSRLVQNSKDLTFNIQSNLLGALDVVKTLQSAYVVKNYLLQSDKNYSNMDDKRREEKIKRLNRRWMNAIDKNDPFVQKYINNKLSSYLRVQKEVLPGVYGEIFVTNKYGAMIATTDKLTTLAHAQKYWWKECYDYGAGKVFFDDRGFDESVGGYVLGIVVPIKKDGEIIGILKANINVQALLEGVVKKYNQQKESVAKVVRSKGLVVYEENLPPLSTRISPDIVKLIKKQKEGIATLKVYDSVKLVSYSPLRVSLDNENITFGGKKRSVDHLLGNDGEIWYMVISKSINSIYSEVGSAAHEIIYLSLLFIVFLSLLIFFVIHRMSVPIHKLSIAVNQITKGNRDVDIDVKSNDEVGELAQSFKKMLENLDKTTASRDELKAEIQKRIEIQKELKRKDEILVAQSKQAAMGEMIGMIAHQWRQPISVISMSVNNILIDMELDELKEENVRECSSEILNETKHLSQTIDDFRNFFKPNKKKETVLVQELYDDVYKLVWKFFENNGIELIFSGDRDIKIYTFGRELLQVFINILNNAKDAFAGSSVENKKVLVSACRKKDDVLFEFCDNAGGVKEEIMGRIFEPYFSTKDEKNGTGLGLYMSKTIIEKHLLGRIWVENRDKGACFMIELPTNLGENSE
ncbi:MAG: ATP-binding protein [Sulfurospirillum sp.]